MEIDEGLVRKNRFCRGGRGGLKCSGEVEDQETINRVIALLIEALRRLINWCVWDQWWIGEKEKELLRLRNDAETKFRGRYSDDVVDDLLKVIDGFIQYIAEFRKYWIENNIGDEIKKLIEDLRNGKADVVIRSTGKALTISAYGKYAILEVSRLGGMRVRLIFRKIRGVTIDVPDIFRKVMGRDEYEDFTKILQGLRRGFAETDEGVDGVRPRMGTAQTWQVILWSLLYPGRVRAFINAVDVNVEGVAMVWQLRANSHKSLRNSTYEVLNDKETLMAFMLTAVLGDGYAYITDKPRIKLVIGTAKFRRWEPILNQLSNIGFKWSPQPGRDAVQITFTAGYAIDMAQAMINIAPPILRDILDVLSIEKWQRMKKIANMEVRFRLGESRVLVGGEPFTVAVSRGSVRLLRKVRDWAGVYRVLEVLRGGYGEDFVSQVKVHRSGGYIVIAIPARLIEGREDIRAQVISVLCRKYWRTSDDSRRMEVVRALSRFASLETISACLGNASQPH